MDSLQQPQSFEDLKVWQLAMDWAESVYRVSRAWPSDERFGLTSQTRRAAVSIAANIAEGAGRRGTGEYIHVLGITRGSLMEARTLLLLSARLGYTEQPVGRALRTDADEIGRLLSGLMRTLNERRRQH